MSRRDPALPRERDEPVLEFAFAKRMTYASRIRWVAGLVFAGMLLQVVFVNVLPGLPALAAAVALSWVVGFDNRIDRRGLRPDEAWRRVPFDRVSAVVDLDAQIKRWDVSAVDVTSPIGCFLLGVAGLVIGTATVIAGTLFGVQPALIVAFDGAALVLLQWLSGMRTVHRKPDLVLKSRHLSLVVDECGDAIDAAGTLHGQLLLAGEGPDAVPKDARLLIDVADPPGRMLSVQGQVVLNRVGGTPYPYFYCVVIADAGSGLQRFAAPLATNGGGTTIDVKSEGDVEVVVVRQTTSKTSGYHTDVETSGRLLQAALDVATHFREAMAVGA